MVNKEVELDQIRSILDPNLTGMDKARALSVAFEWAAHQETGVDWAKEHLYLTNGHELPPEAREYLERLLEPQMQSFWINVYLYKEAYTCGGAIRNSREEVEAARHDLGRRYIGPVEIKLPALPPSDLPISKEDVA